MTMKHSSDEKGAALVVVLAIVVMSTALLAVVMHFMQRGTETSALEQKYETAKDASLGAIDVFAKEIIPIAISRAQITPDTALTSTLGTFNTITSASITPHPDYNACFSDKLLKSTSATNWAGCASYDQARSSNPKESPDITFTLTSTSGQPFRVFSKIVDTVQGNSNTSEVTLEGGAAADSSGSGGVLVQHFPYMYSMEVQGERQNNPSERARFEVLYAY
jgi:hypothetical protein